jgi:DNA-3-methyladenine glycosylase II
MPRRTPIARLSDPFRHAQRHLARRDAILKRLIQTVGPCTLKLNPDSFHVLVRAIISQMISTKAAIAVGNRLTTLLGEDGLTPEAILARKENELRNVGLSGAKARSLLDLAERAQSGDLPLDQLPEMSDDEVITSLVQVRGIGRWTAEMFLIFSLGRLDVLPVGDLGLRAGFQDQYGLKALPDADTLWKGAEPWRPYRSIATWYLWRSRGGVPQSK